MTTSKDGEIRKIHSLAKDTSLGLVLPKEYATDLRIRKGDHVRVSKEGTRVIVEKI